MKQIRAIALLLVIFPVLAFSELKVLALKQSNTWLPVPTSVTGQTEPHYGLMVSVRSDDDASAYRVKLTTVEPDGESAVQVRLVEVHAAYWTTLYFRLKGADSHVQSISVSSLREASTKTVSY